jgi:hypothetical protein
MDELLKIGSALIPFLLTIIVVVLLLIASHKVLLGNKSIHQEAKLPRKLILLLLYIIGIIGIAIK